MKEFVGLWRTEYGSKFVALKREQEQESNEEEEFRGLWSFEEEEQVLKKNFVSEEEENWSKCRGWLWGKWRRKT